MNKQQLFLIIAILVVGFICCHPFHKVGAKSLNAIVDARDGERYGYVKINKRYWLTENMRYHVEGSKLNPNNPDPIYGRLYNWEQAMKACPEGWRLSSTYEWMSLENLFIESTDEVIAMGRFREDNAKILKSKKGWATAGTDSLGLNILPTGRADNNEFVYLERLAFFWTSDEDMRGGGLAERFAEYRYFNSDSLGVFYGIHNKKDNYYSCRCVKTVKELKD